MIHHSVNETTTTIGQATATVIASTMSYSDELITTLELVYPRYIHSELMTHRMFSRNASSSRATPLSVTVAEVANDPVFFDFVGVNQSGMVAGEELSPELLDDFKRDWEALGLYVADMVAEWSKRYGIHKQTLNRALEPWSRIRTLVTATEWDNFFKLRLAEDAQPEIRSLAMAMRGAMSKSHPVSGFVHLPYITDDELNTIVRDDWQLISAARCARVSYARLDGKPTDYEADLKLAHRLWESGHFTPFEHPATTADDMMFANFKGWQSYRNANGK